MSKAKGVAKIRNLTGREGAHPIPTEPPMGIHGSVELPAGVEDIKTFIRSKVAKSRGTFVVGEITYAIITINGKQYAVFEVE